MPPKKKNSKRPSQGPYWFFMEEFRKKQEEAGWTFRGGSHEVQLRASPYWNAMSYEERAPYVQMAKQHREWLREHGEKYTSQGVPMSVVEAEERAKAQKQDLIKNTISSMLETAVANNELDTLEFCFISFAYFCCTSNGTYIPAEMGVVRFSLKDGVKDKLHMLIDPGKLPLGFSYDAKQHSEMDHQLPLPPNALGVKDNDDIIVKLLEFLSQDQKLSPLFTETTEMKMVENILKGILNQAAMDENTLLLCPLSDLFFKLKCATESYGLDVQIFPSVHIAQAIIQKDVYEYTKDIACDFHEKRGNGKYCALSKCMRWAFIIADSCCLDLQVEMKPGKHLPMNADTDLCNTTILGDNSSYVSNQFDNESFVSSSDVTHMTFPKVSKLSRNHYDSYDDRNTSRVYSSSRGLDRKIKDEYPSLNESSSSSRHRRDSSRRDDSPSRSSRDSYDRRHHTDRDSGRRERSDRERARDDDRDKHRDSLSKRGRSSPDRHRRSSSSRKSPPSSSSRDRRESSRSRRDHSPRSSSSSRRVKQERRSTSTDSEGDSPRRVVPLSSELPRTGGYGRGSLFKVPEPPRSPPGSSVFASSDFPELGAVRSAGRGKLSK